MASVSNNDEEGINGINVTPLVDVTLVLLIIFMVTAKLIAGHGVPLDLPKAATAGVTQTMLTLSIDAEGNVLANGRPVTSDAALRDQTKKALRQNPELRTVIAASAAARHGSVMHVVDTVRDAGAVKIAFAADKVAANVGKQPRPKMETMIMNQTETPLDSLVGELFGRASRKQHLVAVGWVLALGCHAALALLFASQHEAAALERTPPPVDVEFLAPPEPPPPAPQEVAPPEEPKSAPTEVAAPAPPSAARAGALHLAKPDAAPAQEQEEAVDFTTDPHGASYGGGVVAVGGGAAFAAAGARVAAVTGNGPLAPVSARPVADALTPVSDLSRKPRLPSSDPCRGFFPSAAQDDVGEVGVMVTIGKSGAVSRTQLVSEAPRGQGFGAAARTCLASQTFVPALDRAGNAAATAIRVNLRFSR